MAEYCAMCDAVGPCGQALPENTVLWEADSFVVIPTLGQFVEGWLMIVSKSHLPSAQYLPKDELIELSETVQQVVSAVETTYGNCVVFEHGHGPTRHTSAGCCVAHTHLHVAPCRSRSRLTSLIPFEPQLELRLPDLPTIANTGYLLLSSDWRQGLYDYYAITTVIPRQFLRQVLAVAQGSEDIWDWRRFPCHDNIRRTLERLGPVLCKKLQCLEVY